MFEGGNGVAKAVPSKKRKREGVSSTSTSASSSSSSSLSSAKSNGKTGGSRSEDAATAVEPPKQPGAKRARVALSALQQRFQKKLEGGSFLPLCVSLSLLLW